MKENKTKPDIRFKGFTEAWEQRKLGDILQRRVEQKQQSEEYPRLAFASGQGVIPLSERKTNNREQLTKDEFTKKYLVTELDDIVYNPANVKYGAIDRNKYGRGLISPIYVTFTTSEISGFIERIVTSHDFQQRALRFEEGTVTKRQSVNPEDLITLDILIAPQREEQRKISECFGNLDNLITLHQRECDHLKELKKSMLKKMFPRDGSSFPEVRFAGFTDAWEQRKLGDIVQITMGQSPNGETYSEEPSTYILVQGNADLNNGWVVPRVWTTQLTKQADKGDLIMSVRAPAGTMGKTAYNVVIGRGVAAIKGNEFIFQSLVKMDESGYWKRLSTGSTFESLNSDNIKNAIMYVPSKEEQSKIGTNFSNLDNLITLHQRELEILKNLKKTCLKRMFI